LKPLKHPNEVKELNEFQKRLEAAEWKHGIGATGEGEEREETVPEYNHKCAELRMARIAEYIRMGVPEIDVYHLCWLMSSDYEIGEPFELRFTPEERYLRRKKDWAHHDTSWCNRNVSMNDENSCNYLRCIPACRYYPDEGRIEDDEVIKKHEEYWAEQRRKGEEMLAQKQREHAEWIALTEEEREQRRQQRIREWKEEEAWGMANQRGELGPINQRKPPQWWLDQYRRKKQQEQQRLL
jgi:hypothetical protein